MQKSMQKLMQVQVQKVDANEYAKVCQTKIDAKIDAKLGTKPGAKDDTKLGIKFGAKRGAKPIAIPGAKLGVRFGAKLDANFVSSFAPYLINGCKQHQKWALDEKKEVKRDANRWFCCSVSCKANQKPLAPLFPKSEMVDKIWVLAQHKTPLSMNSSLS